MLSLGRFRERRQGSCLDLDHSVTLSIFGKVLATTSMVLLFFSEMDSYHNMHPLLPCLTVGVGLIKRQQA